MVYCHHRRRCQSRLSVLTLSLSFAKMEDLDLPEIKRKKVQEQKAEDKKEFKDLFESDSDSDDEGAGLKVKGEMSHYVLSPVLSLSLTYSFFPPPSHTYRFFCF